MTGNDGFKAVKIILLIILLVLAQSHFLCDAGFRS